MKEFIISTDSGCDLTLETCKKYDIVPYLMSYSNEETVYQDTMDDSDKLNFYKQMEDGKVFKTAAVNIDQAYRFLESLVKEGLPIIHICLGSGISSTYNNFINAKELILTKYEDAVIHIIDSTLASVGYGILAIEASTLRSLGKNANEVVKYLEENKRKINTYYTTSTLKYLARGGRVSKIASVFGTILSIKPILRLDNEGHLLVESTGHGKKNTFEKLKKYIKETVINPEAQILYISHTMNSEDVKVLGEEVKKEFGFKEVIYTVIGSIIGSHAGPGLVSFFYHGTPRTESNEKNS